MIVSLFLEVYLYVTYLSLIKYIIEEFKLYTTEEN